MRWLKDLLQPARSKVWIGVFIMAIHLALALYSAGPIVCFDSCSKPNRVQEALAFTISPFSIARPIKDLIEKILPEFIAVLSSFLIVLLILAFFWYLLSCVLVKICRSFRIRPRIA